MEDDMLKEFVVEALDLATNVEEHLLSLGRNPDDMQTLNAVFRSFHTIKGGAGFMNLTAMVEACHLTENLFDALRTGNAPVTSAAIEAALEASGFVADQLKALQNATAPDQLPPMPHALEVALTNAIEGQSSTTIATTAPTIQVTQIVAPSTEDNIDWTSYFDAVVPNNTVERITELPAAELPVAIPESPAKPAAPLVKVTAAEVKQHGNQPKDESIRIDIAKLDVLLEIAGESVQAANQAGVLLEKLSQFKMNDSASTLMTALVETLSRGSRYSTELQRASLATRMQPVGRLFQKFPRMVRELAKDLEKDVDLHITGADTEVDRVVVDSLYDPLVHMIRNSLDHGIENREDRALTNKPTKATISLKAWQEASNVMIEVTDDGKGMDANRLRSIAMSKGLIGAGDALTQQEAYQLVFLPGFSTKEVATSVSGRGVGMDVVKTAIERHRGSIHITSNLGTGTCFAIRLPIELSIVPTLLVRTSGAALGLSMSVVQRVVELPEHFETVGGAAVMRDQGIPLPVRSLASLLGYESCNERVGIVIGADSPYILALESVEGASDLVIKPLTCIQTPGITGTTRSAEGELVLVIGVSFLMKTSNLSGAIAA